MTNPISRLLLVVCMLFGIKSSYADAVQDCQQAKDPKVVVTGCTQLINSGRGNNKQRATMFFLRGQAQTTLKEVDLALKDYDQAISLNQDALDIYLYRADLQLTRKNYAGAKQDYDHVISAVPGSAVPLISSSDKDQSDRILERFLEKGDAYLGRGFLCRDQGDPDGARGEFGKAIETYGSVISGSSSNFRAYHRRARVNQLQYRYTQAAADYDQAASLLEATIPTISDKGRIDAIRDAVKEWRTRSEYSKTMAELDKRFADYLESIEKSHTYPNWSLPPWTTFRRVHLAERMPLAASVAENSVQEQTKKH